MKSGRCCCLAGARPYSRSGSPKRLPWNPSISRNGGRRCDRGVVLRQPHRARRSSVARLRGERRLVEHCRSFPRRHAPFVALLRSGMGRSDWRDRYSAHSYAAEALAVAESQGLFDAAEKPVFVAHSLRGTALLHVVTAAGERLRPAVLVDAGVRSEGRFRPTLRTAPHRICASPEEPIARFRLLPPPSRNSLLDWIARIRSARYRTRPSKGRVGRGASTRNC